MGAMAYWQEISPGREGESNSAYDEPVLWNFPEMELLVCPQCSSDLNIGWDGISKASAHSVWWHGLDEMNYFYEERALVSMPCCGASLPLRDILCCCRPHPALSRYVCGLLEPDFDPFEGDRGPLLGQHLARFESILGCRLHQMWQNAWA